jgi:hypothetical protein
MNESEYVWKPFWKPRRGGLFIARPASGWLLFFVFRRRGCAAGMDSRPNSAPPKNKKQLGWVGRGSYKPATPMGFAPSTPRFVNLSAVFRSVS